MSILLVLPFVVVKPETDDEADDDDDAADASPLPVPIPSSDPTPREERSKNSAIACNGKLGGRGKVLKDADRWVL